jgi:orotidine 5'-phosphate decarboxylase
MAGYAQAYLSDGAPLAADSITVSPYLGYGALSPALDLAEASGRGVFVLALTSNPEGAAVQHAVNGERAVAAGVVEGVTASNATASGEGRLGSVGLVVGATVGEAVCRLGIDLLRANGPLLAPGIGAQGAGPAELESVFGPARRHVLASTSRGVLKAGPSIEALRTAALAATHEAAAALR